MKEIGLAIIGAGFIGNMHARAAQNCGARIVAVCARTRESAERFAQKYGVPYATTSASALVKRKEVDAAVIAHPNRYHAPHSIAMIEAGKDVLLEKPMSVTAAEAMEIARAARRKKRVVLVGHMWRFDEEVNYVREAVKSGRIGDVVKTKSYGVHALWGPSGWFVDKKLAGGGALVDMGVHAIDTTRYLMGDPAPASVYAHVDTRYGDYKVDDVGVLFIKWKNGVVSVVESGWWNPHMDGPEASTQLFGTRGYARVFPTEVKLEMDGRMGTFHPALPPREDHCAQVMYDRQMSCFLSSVATRKAPSPGLDEGLVNMRILEAAYKSSRLGQAVKL